MARNFKKIDRWQDHSRMGTMMILAEEKKFDQAFLVSDELSAVYHSEDFLFACPAHSLHFFCLQMKRSDIDIPRQ